MPHPKYRPDIDGLRATAVLAVVLFHAYPGIFKGGFIGVDIFFVISGFLISTILFESLDAGEFSFYEFYARRIKRIFPALILVLVVSSIFGWFSLLTDEYKQLGKHIAAGAGFISNIVLWSEAGYFDNSAQTKPLLHLWSLGIEEQFYLLWPLLVWLAWKGKINVILVILSLIAGSFFVNIDGVEQDPVASFYSPMSRFWELSSGSLLAWLILKNQAKINVLTDTWRNLLSIIGALLILGGVFGLSSDLLFPGWLALLPVVSAILLILSGGNAIINRVVLSSRVAVWIGLISYPLYLWHWPILSYIRIIESGAPKKIVVIIAVIAAFILAWLTYRFIERPIRFGSKGSAKVKALACSMLILGCFGLMSNFNESLVTTRISKFVNPEVVKALGDFSYPSGLSKVNYKDHNLYKNSEQEPEVLLFGDSHIEHLAPRVLELTTSGSAKDITFFTSGGCPPIPLVFEDFHPDCKTNIERMQSYLKQHPGIKTIVIGACWNCYFISQTAATREEGDTYNYYYKNADLKEPFRQGSGKTMALAELGKFIKLLSHDYSVYFILDNPMDKKFSPTQMLGSKSGRKRLVFGDKPELDHFNAVNFPVDAAQLALNEELKHLASMPGVAVVDLIDRICPNRVCASLDAMNRPIYKDSQHMRPFFVRETIDQIDPALLKSSM